MKGIRLLSLVLVLCTWLSFGVFATEADLYTVSYIGFDGKTVEQTEGVEYETKTLLPQLEDVVKDGVTYENYAWTLTEGSTFRAKEPGEESTLILNHMTYYSLWQEKEDDSDSKENDLVLDGITATGIKSMYDGSYYDVTNWSERLLKLSAIEVLDVNSVPVDEEFITYRVFNDQTGVWGEWQEENPLFLNVNYDENFNAIPYKVEYNVTIGEAVATGSAEVLITPRPVLYVVNSFEMDAYNAITLADIDIYSGSPAKFEAATFPTEGWRGTSPSWIYGFPYHVYSNGQYGSADIARKLYDENMNVYSADLNNNGYTPIDGEEYAFYWNAQDYKGGLNPDNPSDILELTGNVPELKPIFKYDENQDQNFGYSLDISAMEEAYGGYVLANYDLNVAFVEEGVKSVDIEIPFYTVEQSLQLLEYSSKAKINVRVDIDEDLMEGVTNFKINEHAMNKKWFYANDEVRTTDEYKDVDFVISYTKNGQNFSETITVNSGKLNYFVEDVDTFETEWNSEADIALALNASYGTDFTAEDIKIQSAKAGSGVVFFKAPARDGSGEERSGKATLNMTPEQQSVEVYFLASEFGIDPIYKLVNLNEGVVTPTLDSFQKGNFKYELTGWTEVVVTVDEDGTTNFDEIIDSSYTPGETTDALTESTTFRAVYKKTFVF